MKPFSVHGKLVEIKACSPDIWYLCCTPCLIINILWHTAGGSHAAYQWYPDWINLGRHMHADSVLQPTCNYACLRPRLHIKNSSMSRVQSYEFCRYHGKLGMKLKRASRGAHCLAMNSSRTVCNARSSSMTLAPGEFGNSAAAQKKILL